jgi:hypothetical protein
LRIEQRAQRCQTFPYAKSIHQVSSIDTVETSHPESGDETGAYSFRENSYIKLGEINVYGEPLKAISKLHQLGLDVKEKASEDIGLIQAEAGPCNLYGSDIPSLKWVCLAWVT